MVSLNLGPMILLSTDRLIGTLAVVGLLLAGCASKSNVEPPVVTPAPPPIVAPEPAPPKAPSFTATPGLDPHERARKIFDLLNAGQAGQARAEAEQLLLEDPGNAQAKSAIDQIDGDPKAELGAQNFSYELRQGETLSVLAERYLGDRTKFYALARYNGISVPNQAAVGQTILIPGTPRKITQTPKPKAQPPEPRKAPVTVAPPPTDPRKASALRSQALVQMNKGAIDKAVSLLRQAAQADPTNAAVSGDLARALRIQAATRH